MINLQRKALGAFLLATFMGTSVAQSVVLAPATGEVPTDQLIVKYRVSSRSAVSLHAQDLLALRTHALAAGFNVALLRRTSDGAHVLKLDRRASLATLRLIAAAAAKADATIEYAEPDAIALPAQVPPNDPAYAVNQWPLFDPTGGISAPSAWSYATGSGVVVAIIDTGYRPHPELLANGYNGFDFVSDPANTHDGNGRESDAQDPGDWRVANQCPSPFDQAANSSWHGTHVAGIVGAQWNNGVGIAGAAPNAKLLGVRVLGTCGGYASDIADGITWSSGGTVAGAPANPTPARVLNLSIGGLASCPASIQSAINGARSRDSVVVVAAGNNNGNASSSMPANCAGVIPVAATDPSGARYALSNTGSIVALAAPGVSVYSTLNTGATTPGADSYQYYSGTSMAAPHVAAVAALMRSVNATLRPDDIAIVLKGTTRAFPVACAGCGTGILSAANAVNAVRPGALKGTFSTTYATRSGTTSLVIISNTSSGWITGISASCANSGSYITVPPPSALGPGQNMTIQASVSPSTYMCNYVISGNNATSSPHTVPTF